jgi:hypothetical protein
MSQLPETKYEDAAMGRFLQIGRIIICILSMGFIFPHAAADGLNGPPPAPKK